MQEHVLYEYSDGNANLYILTAYRLRYIPVKPEDSSTGFYRGGEPFEVILSKTEYNQLKGLLEQAICEADSHVSSRLKGSGKIMRLTPSDTLSVIIRPDKPIFLALEMYLRELKRAD